MIELYKKMISKSFTIQDALEFIKEAAKAINPSVPYNEDYTLIAFKSSFGDIILNRVISCVESNPDKVGFQVTKLYSIPDKYGNRYPIKTIVKPLK